MVKTTRRSAFEIIPYSLKISQSTSTIFITPLKLQKLLYYFQAWSLAFRRRPLFYEDIEAWVHGPVVAAVYQRYKQYSYNILPQEDLLNNLEPDEIEIINIVMMTYGNKSAKFLEDLTHSEYPWINARAGLTPNRRSDKKRLSGHKEVKCS